MHRANFSSLLARRRLGALPLAGGVALLAAMIPTAQASAATSGCTTSGSQVTCTFTETGGAQTWTVPAGVTQATFTLYGARGGGLIRVATCVLRCSATPDGGLGAQVTATLPVRAGTVLQVNVGQAGAGNSAESFGGGGEAGAGGAGGGGGASDVRTPASDGTYPLADRLLVAGGGGGAAENGTPSAGAGGNADSPGQAGSSADNSGATLGGGAGGGAGTSSGPGGGGAGGTVSGTSTCAVPSPGAAGAAGGTGTGQDTGGDGGVGASGAETSSGGGGGGGYYGGGGGGGGAGVGNAPGCTQYGMGGGGGGGASYTGTAAGALVNDGVAAPDDAPNGEVIITYTV